MINDWVGDRLWSLKWADDGPFTLFRAEMATRVAVAESIASRLVVGKGLRPDRAMAEAVMVVTTHDPVPAALVDEIVASGGSLAGRAVAL